MKELIALPSQAGRVMSQVERGELIVQVPAVSRQIVSLERAINRLTGSVIFAVLFLGGIMFYSAGKELLAYILFGASVLVLIWTAFSRRGGSPRFHP